MFQIEGAACPKSPHQVVRPAKVEQEENLDKALVVIFGCGDLY